MVSAQAPSFWDSRISTPPVVACGTGEVLPLEGGVHGHLGAAASAQGWGEVYGSLAPALLDERQRLWRYNYIH